MAIKTGDTKSGVAIKSPTPNKKKPQRLRQGSLQPLN